MNIFVSDECPIKSAEALDLKRTIKMILESTQMLCTAINERAGKQITPYKSTHKNHPVNIWCRESQSNWIWLFDHAARLCTIYKATYGKVHKCQHILNELSNKGYVQYIPIGPLTPFANCAAHKAKGFDFKNIKPTTEAYKQYLNARWKTDTRKPEWFNKPKWALYGQK